MYNPKVTVVLPIYKEFYLSSIQLCEKKNYSKVVGVCPKCGKDVVTRKSKHGKIFYACSGYPNCDFVSWDRPTGKLCPNCKSHLVYAAGDKVKCSNTECDYVE